MPKNKDLVQIIRDNPGCVALIDIDNWQLYKAGHFPIPEFVSGDYAEYGKAQEKRSKDFFLVDGNEDNLVVDGRPCDGNRYGEDILCALAKIVGITLEWV